MEYIVGLALLLWCMSLSTKVSKLERKVKEISGVDPEKTSLREILEKSIGKTGKIQFESDSEDYDIMSKTCLIEDVDKDWLLVKIEKSDIEKLLRIESIKGIQFK